MGPGAACTGLLRGPVDGTRRFATTPVRKYSPTDGTQMCSKGDPGDHGWWCFESVNIVCECNISIFNELRAGRPAPHPPGGDVHPPVPLPLAGTLRIYFQSVSLLFVSRSARGSRTRRYRLSVALRRTTSALLANFVAKHAFSCTYAISRANPVRDGFNLAHWIRISDSASVSQAADNTQFDNLIRYSVLR